MSQKIAIVRMSMPGEPTNLFLDRWLRARAAEGYEVREAAYSLPIDAKRNIEVRRFLDETDADALLMLDSDMVPLETTKAILANGSVDVGWCRTITRQGNLCHTGAGSCSAACLRISRRAACAIAPPWFQFTMPPDGGVPLACECEYFAGRALEAGFPPTLAGTVGHLVSVIAYPDDAGEARILWAATEWALRARRQSQEGVPRPLPSQVPPVSVETPPASAESGMP